MLLNNRLRYWKPGIFERLTGLVVLPFIVF